MDHKKIYELLKKLNIPVAYDHFDNQPTNPPFIVYREGMPDSLKADNKNYINFPNFEIELVTIKKDINLENKLTSLLFNNDIPYDKTPEIWDKEEKIYHIFYEI